jgi:hypothetical protein
MIFIDLERELGRSTSKDVIVRIMELQNKLSGVHLYSIGGFPIKEYCGSYFIFGEKLTPDMFKKKIAEAVGLSGMMTYMNKSDLSLGDLGNKCIKLNHTWALNWITLSFLVCLPNSNKVEKSLLRDKNFYESWPVTRSGESDVFGVTGSVKSFKKFIGHKDDGSFDSDTRSFMRLLSEEFKFIWDI